MNKFNLGRKVWRSLSENFILWDETIPATPHLPIRGIKMEKVTVQCANMIPGNNFATIAQCPKPATVELTFTGGKVASYCVACQGPVVDLMTFFSGHAGTVASFVIL